MGLERRWRPSRTMPRPAPACRSSTPTLPLRHPIGDRTRPAGPGPRARRRAVELAPSSSWARYASASPAGSPAMPWAGSRPSRWAGRSTRTTRRSLPTSASATRCWRAGTRPCRCSSIGRSNPAQPGSYRIGLFLYHYAHGRYTEALAEALRTRPPTSSTATSPSPPPPARLGRPEEAAAALEFILGIDRDYGSHVVADLESRSVAPWLIPAVVDGLVAAGLRVTDIRLPAASTGLSLIR